MNIVICRGKYCIIFNRQRAQSAQMLYVLELRGLKLSLWYMYYYKE